MWSASSSVTDADDAADLNIEDDDRVLYGDAQNPLCTSCTLQFFCLTRLLIFPKLLQAKASLSTEPWEITVKTVTGVLQCQNIANGKSPMGLAHS